MFLSNSLVLLVSGLTLGQAYYGDDHHDHIDLTKYPVSPAYEFTCDHVPHGGGTRKLQDVDGVEDLPDVLRKLQEEDPAFMGGGPINPCEEWGPGLYPFGPNWWYDWLTSSSTKYIQCGNGGHGPPHGKPHGGGGYGGGYGYMRKKPSCDVKHCAPGTVFNPIIGNCVHDCDVGKHYKPGLPADASPQGPPAYCLNSCLFAVSGTPIGYGPVEETKKDPVHYLPFDPQNFCQGAPYWEGDVPLDADVAGYDDDYSSKFIQCDKFGGCFVMPCPYGTKWDQYVQTCASPYHYGYYYHGPYGPSD